jgi:hypothetical protein
MLHIHRKRAGILTAAFSGYMPDMLTCMKLVNHGKVAIYNPCMQHKKHACFTLYINRMRPNWPLAGDGQEAGVQRCFLITDQ